MLSVAWPASAALSSELGIVHNEPLDQQECLS